MKFGIHNPSWVDGPDPAEAFEAVKAKAQWAEIHGFDWFSVQDHMIQTLTALYIIVRGYDNIYRSLRKPAVITRWNRVFFDQDTDQKL